MDGANDMARAMVFGPVVPERTIRCLTRLGSRALRCVAMARPVGWNIDMSRASRARTVRHRITLSKLFSNPGSRGLENPDGRTRVG